MSENQKIVSAWTAVGILTLGVLFMVSLALTSSENAFYYQNEAGDPFLILQWDIAAYFMKYGTALKAIFGTLLAGLSIMVTKVADIYTRKLHIAIIVVLALIGIAAATLAMIRISSSAIIDNFQYVSGLSELSMEAFIEAIQSYFGAFIGWFVTFLLAVLGISLASDDGVLNRLIKGG